MTECGHEIQATLGEPTRCVRPVGHDGRHGEHLFIDDMPEFNFGRTDGGWA